MKRREVLLSLSATAVAAVATPKLVEAIQKRELTEEEVASLLRYVAGVEPREGEPDRVRTLLNQLRSRSETDPRVQPALSFNPAVEP